MYSPTVGTPEEEVKLGVVPLPLFRHHFERGAVFGDEHRGGVDELLALRIRRRRRDWGEFRGGWSGGGEVSASL
jgi:hypothetical protein